MHRTCIAIMDASRARLFTLDRTAETGTVSESLVEDTGLVNPARRTEGSEWDYDDHRNHRIEELERTFAKQVATEVRRLTADPKVRRLIVCASPNMLGELRQVASFERPGLEIEETARDLVKLTPHQIRTQLGEYGLLPA
ncbi:MAG: host attachment protein [Myxococcales bacterium]|nr:host attachment protein [Myxococcales bacterium]